MRKILKQIIISTTVLVFLFSCTSKEPTAPPSEQELNYFPNSDSTTYLYEITEFDSTGIFRSGLRYILYFGI